MKLVLKIGVVLLIIGIASALGYSYYTDSYVPYVPVKCVEGAGIVKAPELDTPKHQREIKKVLQLKFIKFKVVNGKVWIQRKMYLDEYWRGYLWNMTMAADNPSNRPRTKVMPYKEYPKEYKWQAVIPETEPTFDTD